MFMPYSPGELASAVTIVDCTCEERKSQTSSHVYIFWVRGLMIRKFKSSLGWTSVLVWLNKKGGSLDSGLSIVKP
jgi:hypothetical protein